MRRMKREGRMKKSEELSEGIENKRRKVRVIEMRDGMRKRRMGMWKGFGE